MPVDATIHIVTYIEVAPASSGSGVDLVRRCREAMRSQADNAGADLLRRVERDGHFAMVSAWASQSAAEAQAGAAAVMSAQAALSPLLLSPCDERTHTGFSVGPPSATAGAAGVWTLTHVDVIPPRKDDGVALLARLAEESRREPGCTRFDVLQQTNRPNHLTVVEAWRDRAAFDAHAAAAHTRHFRAQLAPMSGALYDERLYAALD